MKENDLITALKARFPMAGLGDDAAVLSPCSGDMLLASDAVVEGVHFTLASSTPGQAVQKAVASNVSDIYAMAGTPEYVLLTAGIPPGATRDDLDGIVEGLASACRAYSVVIAGGDTVSSPGGYFFDVAVAGSVAPGAAVKRSGAEPGDLLMISGPVGGSMAGLRLLEAAGGRGVPGRGFSAAGQAGQRFLEAVPALVRNLSSDTSPEEIAEACRNAGLDPGAAPMLDMVRHHVVPVVKAPVIPPGSPAVTSMIDVSDGIARDLRTLCEAGGTGAVVETGRIPRHSGLEAMRSRFEGITDETLERLVLTSGEEYVRLFTLRSAGEDPLPETGHVVGEIVDAEDGIMIRTPEGRLEELPPGGWQHGF